MGATCALATQAHALAVFLPGRQIRDELEAEHTARFQHACDRGERRGQIALAQQRLQNSVRRNHERKRSIVEWQMPDVAAHEL